MYLVIEVDSDIQVIVFNWVFEYEVMFDVRDIDMWHLILYVNDVSGEMLRCLMIVICQRMYFGFVYVLMKSLIMQCK